MPTYPFKNWNREAARYDPDADELDPALVARWARVAKYYADYFKTELTGVENIPADEGALIVSNHGPWGIDSPALFHRLYQQTGRVPRGLAEHMLVKLPIFGRLFRAMGAVDGNRENAVQLLKNRQLVVVYPGGHRDVFKPAEQRYKLQWERSRGYLKVAVEAGAPIIPVAGIGIDEALLTVGHERKFGRWLFGKTDYDLPITLGLGLLPLPVKFTFHVGEPIRLDMSPDALDDAEVLERLHQQVWETTQNLIEGERRRRFSASET